MPSSAEPATGSPGQHGAGAELTASLAVADLSLGTVPAPELGPRAVLKSLDEDELGQYEAIARDQVARETKWRWLLALIAAAAVPIALWGLAKGFQAGFGATVFGLLGLAGMMGYVPYRVSKARQMWQSHLDAVAMERQRRSVDGHHGD